MSVFKCKMCGGTMEVEQGSTVCTCEYCGTKQTLPKLDDDRRASMYDRANHFRRNNEFDKASGIYEQILNEDSTDAEAYWSLVLCRYGIEYVEDPATHKRLPTVNRAQYTSIYADEDYKSAIQNADPLQKTVYEAEAKAIDEIQKGILEISSREEPFDVFISFKETGADGKRTRDAVLAHELYNELEKEGYKTFFAPVTLEDKLGTEYEPYIFAALNSAKVMVVLGTKPEHFNAVWVKNEWSRFLALIKNGAKKTLIPAYKDMDPYDLPEEFSNLLAQDMNKLGFMQDLLRGIRKIVDADKAKNTTAVKETVVVNNVSAGNVSAAGVAPLLKRTFMFLEDGDWNSANEYCERVLDQDPENAQAYLGKLMAELRVRKQEDLKNCDKPFDGRSNYQKIIRFADPSLAESIKGDIALINERNENARLTGIYSRALSAMQKAETEEAYKSTASTFKSISGFKDAEELAGQCLEKAEICRKNAIYSKGISLMSRGLESYYEDAKKEFEKIPGWRDVNAKLRECDSAIAEIQAKRKAEKEESERKAEEARLAAEKAAKRKKKTIVTLLLLAALAVGGYFGYTRVIVPEQHYRAAVAQMEAGEYERAITLFKAMNGYKDSYAQISACQTAIKDNKYAAALSLKESGEYEKAIKDFKALDGYKDSNKQIEACEATIKEDKYTSAVSLKESEEYEKAIKAFEELNGYKDSKEQITETRYFEAVSLKNAGKYAEAYAIFAKLIGYKDVDSIIKTDKDIAAAAAAAARAAVLAQFKVGNTVTFGTYEQDNRTENGKEDIEWTVLENDGEKALLISNFALDSRPYNISYTNVTWETCTLRTWLNGTFLEEAFSGEEQKKIEMTEVSADRNPKYDTNPGNGTKDRIFLLSISETEKYFKSDEARQCAPTAYAKAQGADTNDDYKTAGGEAACWWWLRSPGPNQGDAAIVYGVGSVGYYGSCVNDDLNCVRPALWINLDS